MREIIVASQNPQAADRIRAILQSEHIFVSNLYRSGAEVLSFASIRPDAVVICGKLPDMSAAALAGTLPNGFDTVWLVPSGEPLPAFVSNLIALQMPLNRMEFLNTVRMLATTESECVRPRKTVRTEEENTLLRDAKARLMERHRFSEREAHKLLQHRAMETGMRILEVARLVLEE